MVLPDNARDARHLESYIDKQLEHALRCYAHAAVLIEDARLSVLEAVAGAAEYEDKYGE